MLQTVHQDDVVSAIQLSLRPGIRGIFNLAGPRALRLSQIPKKLKRAHVPIPYDLARFGVRRLWTLLMTSFPAPELDLLRYVCMVDDRRARDVLGYRPSFDIDETLRAVDDERWTSA